MADGRAGLELWVGPECTINRVDERWRDQAELTGFARRPDDFGGLNEEYARWFPADPPTRYVAKLGVELPGVLVSIRMTAFVG